MDLRDEILARVEALSPEQQQQVLQFVTSLASWRGNNTYSALLALAGSLDPVSAREMRQAIEEGCERVDGDQW